MKVPAHLYKYLQIPGGMEDSLKSCFFEKCFTTLKFTAPKDLNDPFDMKCNVNFDGDGKDWEKFHTRMLRDVKRWLQIKGVRPPQKDFDDEVKDELEKTEHERRRRFIAMAESASEGFVVACLSGANDDILMWSHYADCHKGFCLEFSYDELIKYCSGKWDLEEVKYPKANDFISFKEFVDSGEFQRERMVPLAKKILWSKSTHWKYEGEWRIISNINDNLIFESLPPGALTGIILGVNMPKIERIRIRGELKRLGLNIAIYEVKKHDSKYKLEIPEPNSET